MRKLKRISVQLSIFIALFAIFGTYETYAFDVEHFDSWEYSCDIDPMYDTESCQTYFADTSTDEAILIALYVFQGEMVIGFALSDGLLERCAVRVDQNRVYESEVVANSTLCLFGPRQYASQLIDEMKAGSSMRVRFTSYRGRHDTQITLIGFTSAVGPLEGSSR